MNFAIASLYCFLVTSTFEDDTRVIIAGMVTFATMPPRNEIEIEYFGPRQ